MSQSQTPPTRAFDTGATRNNDAGKLDFEGALSPLVLQRYVEFLHKHRPQPDGTIRDADNWQKGMPQEVWMKSAWRHFHAVWLHHRGGAPEGLESFDDAICATIFNLMGLMNDRIKAEKLFEGLPKSPILAGLGGKFPGS